VRLDGAPSNAHLEGDLLAAHTARHHGEDLALTHGEPLACGAALEE
jgi:hypothetical protein